MTSIAFFTLDMTMNGASKALIDILNHLDYDKVSVDVYVCAFGGELDNEFPGQVNVIPVPRYPSDPVGLIGCAAKHPIHFIRSLRQKKGLASEKKHINCEATSFRMPIIDKKYDAAIAFRHYNLDTMYVINNMKAKKKYFWVHGEANLTPDEQELLGKYYKKYDGVFPVSKTAENRLCAYFPWLREKSVILNNITDADKLKRLADEGNGFDDNCQGLRILSIGRLSPEKGFIMAAEACKILSDKGYDFRWYIAGDGIERAKIEKYISQNGISDKLILLGTVMNPYRMLRECDIYVSCSLSETFSLTVMEAKTFERPILSTDIPAIRERVIAGETALLADTTPDSLAEGLAKLLDDECLRKRISYNQSLEEHSDFSMITLFMNKISPERNNERNTPAIGFNKQTPSRKDPRKPQ